MKQLSVNFQALNYRVVNSFGELNPKLIQIFNDIRTQFLTNIGVINTLTAVGTTANRPTKQLTTGQPYYDTTLHKPIYWDATSNFWRDATGTGPI